MRRRDSDAVRPLDHSRKFSVALPALRRTEPREKAADVSCFAAESEPSAPASVVRGGDLADEAVDRANIDTAPGDLVNTLCQRSLITRLWVVKICDAVDLFVLARVNL